MAAESCQRQIRFQRSHLLAGRGQFVLHLFSLPWYFLHGGFEHGSGLFEKIEAPGNQSICPTPGHGLDAAHARRRRTLGDDQERADIRSALEMRATAQLVGMPVLRVANGNGTHYIAILFPKERHGTFGHRLLAWFAQRRDGIVCCDGLVN